MSKDFGFTQGHTGTEHWLAGQTNTYTFDVKAPLGTATVELPNDASTGSQVANMRFVVTEDGIQIPIVNRDDFKMAKHLEQTLVMHGGLIPAVTFDVTPGKHYEVKITADKPMSCQVNLGMTRRR